MTPTTPVRTALTRQVIAGMRWLAALTGDPNGTWLAWAQGHAVPVPLGTAAAVVRIPEELGRAAVGVLAGHAPALVGPVLLDQWAGVVDVFVPAASAVWQGGDVQQIGGRQEPQSRIMCPSPGRTAVGRSWLHLPRALPDCPVVLTDSHRLAKALSVARTRLPVAR
ncbi:hypothetical protein AB0O82_10790 [Kitasatospora sp. NPDC088264]|uniref:hypothetical protein n=1 Tax=Kitasatospora sp. NPDC088264 TaxID=3155296 RepID=UPI00342DDEE5